MSVPGLSSLHASIYTVLLIRNDFPSSLQKPKPYLSHLFLEAFYGNTCHIFIFPLNIHTLYKNLPYIT